MGEQRNDTDAIGRAMAEAMGRILDGQADDREQLKREAENRRAMQSDWWAQACHDRNVKERG